MTRLTALRPELIGGLFGREPSLLMRTPLRKLDARARFLLIAAAASFVLLGLAGVQDVLINVTGFPTALGLIGSLPPSPRQVGLALLQDPVAIVVIVVALTTPFFCAHQVTSIQNFVDMNRQNILVNRGTPPTAEVQRLVERANRRFLTLGNRSVSAALVVSSATVAGLIYYFISANGLLRSWISGTPAVSRDWSRRVYEGWWANWTAHVVLAISLCAIAAYLFYFLTKQIIMGVIFMTFARSAARRGFGVTPNLQLNIDGYWGLRSLRRFMQWTYGSTVSHLFATLGVFIVWLPFSQWAIFVVVSVMMINFTVVLYPSSIAYKSAVSAKRSFAEKIANGDKTREEKDALVTKLWENPILPFRLRSTLTAVSIYLLAPLALVVVSSILKK
jgi:hypothetical protein